MSYSVVIPTNRPIAALLPTLQSLQEQTIAAKQIIIVYDKILTQHDYDNILLVLHQNLQRGMLHRIMLITNITHDFQVENGVSYNRNMGISYTNSDYILCIDDDNTVNSDFIQRLLQLARRAEQKYATHALLVPTEYHKNTIRSRGYSWFSYLFGVPIPYHEEQSFQLGEDYVGQLQFASSNCLFGHRDIFIAHPFDEKLSFVYEDFAMTASVYRDGIPVLVTHSIIVNHHMRSKTPLEDSYIATPVHAYQKAKNRIAFVRILGNKFQKFVYMLLWLHMHSLALIAKIIRYAPWFIAWYVLSYAIIRGTRVGLFTKQ
jgi:GT2 family glycosyltransferase